MKKINENTSVQLYPIVRMCGITDTSLFPHPSVRADSGSGSSFIASRSVQGLVLCSRVAGWEVTCDNRRHS